VSPTLVTTAREVLSLAGQLLIAIDAP